MDTGAQVTQKGLSPGWPDDQYEFKKVIKTNMEMELSQRGQNPFPRNTVSQKKHLMNPTNPLSTFPVADNLFLPSHAMRNTIQESSSYDILDSKLRYSI